MSYGPSATCWQAPHMSGTPTAMLVEPLHTRWALSNTATFWQAPHTSGTPSVTLVGASTCQMGPQQHITRLSHIWHTHSNTGTYWWTSYMPEQLKSHFSGQLHISRLLTVSPATAKLYYYSTHSSNRLPAQLSLLQHVVLFVKIVFLALFYFVGLLKLLAVLLQGAVTQQPLKSPVWLGLNTV